MPDSRADMYGIGSANKRSELRLTHWLGLGSTNTFSPYYTTVDTFVGKAITYNNSTVLGLIVKVNRSGYYAVTAQGNGQSSGGAAGVGVSKNYSADVVASGIPEANRVCSNFDGAGPAGAGDNGPACSKVTWLEAGTTLRVHHQSTVASVTPEICEFAICFLGPW
jgi:hypothetical protein